MMPERVALTGCSWWIGSTEDVPGVNAPAKTRDASVASLCLALQEALEMNRDDAVQAAGVDYTEVKITHEGKGVDPLLGLKPNEKGCRAVSEDNAGVAYTAVIQQSGPWWCGWVAEVAGVNGQETTRERLLDVLGRALAEAISRAPDDIVLIAGQDLTAIKAKPLKRFIVVQHLLQNGCELAGESERFSWWRNKVTQQRASIPRQGEIAKVVCQKICKDCGVDPLH